MERTKIDKDETTALEKENTENNQTDNESAGVDEDNSTNKFDDIDAKSELSTSSRSLRNGKFSNTLTDLTKRMKKNLHHHYLILKIAYRSILITLQVLVLVTQPLTKLQANWI